MTHDSAPTPRDPGDVRPRRALEQAPSVRYGTADTGEKVATGRTALRGGRAALLVATGGAAVIVVLNVVLAVTAGLVAIAAVTGYLVGGALRGVSAEVPPVTAGAGVLGSSRGRGIALAMAVAVGSVLAGALGTWLVSVTAQGGTLGPLDYLAATMGILLPIQILAAAGAAWLGSR